MEKQQTQENGQQAANASQRVPNTHTAVLIRGESYTLGNVMFTPGKRIPIPQYVKDHLEATAVDMVDVEGEAEAKPKFAFEELDEAGNVKPGTSTAPTPRRRAPAREPRD